jgi:hypothetical protein
MKEAGTINFLDANDADNAVVIVCYGGKPVAICVPKTSQKAVV